MSKESDSDDEIILNDARRSSRRSVATTSNSKVQQQSVLERLKQARATGKAFRARVDDLVQDVYMEVDDEEYQAKKQYYREFVEDDDGTGYYDDDSEDDLNDEERESKKKRKEEKRVKAKTGTIKHHFQAITSKQNPKDERSVCVDDDDILKECLADIVGTSDFGSGVEESEPCGSTASDMFSYSFGDFPALSMPNDNFLPASTLSTKENFMAPPTSSSENASISLQTFKTPEARRKPPTPSRTATTPSSSSRPPQSSPVSTAVNPFCVDKSKNLATPMQSCQREPQIREFSPEPVPIIEMDDMQSPPQTPTNSQRKRDASPIPSPMARPTKMARTEVDAKDGLKFFFLDAFEDAYKHPGTIYLFGRVKTLGDSSQTESCCLVLKNVSRQLFFIKRDKSLSTSKAVTAEDLNKEVQNTLKTKCGIARFRCKADLAMKKFISADETVPSECEALEVWANGSLARLPSDLSGDCFSHVMNTTTTPLERLLVEREIYGPCWLLVRNAEQVQCPVSHCPLEYTLNMEQMDGITMIPTSSNDPPPQITLISLNILTALNPETKENQIVMASLIHHTCNLDKPTQFEPKMLVNKRFCIVSKFKKGLNLPFDLEDQLKKNGIQSMVRKVGDEVALLNFLLTRLEDLNPDMILGHDLNAHLTLLHSRMEKYKLKKWDRMGRLKRSAQIQRIGNSKFALWEFTAGRLCLDSKTAASELIHSKSYEMEDLVAKLLKLGRQNLSTEQISAPFLTTNPQLKLIDLIKWNWNENLYTLKIVEQLNAIPLFVQITQIVGGVLSRTLMGGRAERNEFLLLHACFKNNYIPPDKHIFAKPVKNQKSGNMKKAPKKSHTMDVDGETVVIDGDEPTEEANPSAENEQPKKGAFGKKTQYTGGLVLEPKRGLYETYIVLLDFNSLYPSIIQEFNICFTTVDNAFADLVNFVFIF